MWSPLVNHGWLNFFGHQNTFQNSLLIDLQIYTMGICFFNKFKQGSMDPSADP